MHFHNQSDKYQLRCNLHWLCTTSGKAVSQSIPSVSSLKQAWFTTYNHWQRSFTIYSVSLNSKTMLMNYLQALALHIYNQVDHYQLRCNLDSLCASSGTTLSQSIQSVSPPMQPPVTTYLNTGTFKAISQPIPSVSTPKQVWFTVYLNTSTEKAV